jgi:3D (Asp-Asp-Asp) domain-containing protein
MDLITAYCACAVCCRGSSDGITASGTRPVEGRTIAGPRSIPFGTVVEIRGHRYVVEDRTSRRVDGIWDVYFKRHKDAVRFGKRTNEVRVITK